MTDSLIIETDSLAVDCRLTVETESKHIKHRLDAHSRQSADSRGGKPHFFEIKI